MELYIVGKYKTVYAIRDAMRDLLPENSKWIVDFVYACLFSTKDLKLDIKRLKKVYGILLHVSTIAYIVFICVAFSVLAGGKV